MITIEQIKSIVKKELHVNLLEGSTSDYHVSKDYRVYAKQKDDGTWYIVFEKETKYKLTLELRNHQISTEAQLKAMVRKFKKLRVQI